MLLGATFSLSSGFYPQSNGLTELKNQAIDTALRCLASQNHASWTRQQLYVEYVHNTLTIFTTGLSPFQLWVPVSSVPSNGETALLS